MTSPVTVGLLGGTGAQGRGLALRLARAGHEVLIGSRTLDKAQDATDDVAGRVEDDLPLRADRNAEVARDADVVFVTVPYAAQEATLAPLAEVLDGKVVVDCVNALGFDADGPHPLTVPDGSAAQEAARLLPGARVVGAFQNVSAVALLREDEAVEGDVLLVGDDDRARDEVAVLVEAVGLRPVHVGPLRLAKPIEDLTAVLIAVNRRYKAHASIQLTGLGVGADEAVAPGR